ncbi:MAG TPA: hypothetical protein VLA29_05175 [Acidimicrobiia bacterium]|nr:hypothetical protein [Acidimicrobiia bacterium]
MDGPHSGCIETLQQKSKPALHGITFDQEEKAWTWLRHHDGKSYSFVMQRAFRLTRDRRLREALAFDQDSAAAGFLELRP